MLRWDRGYMLSTTKTVYKFSQSNSICGVNTKYLIVVRSNKETYIQLMHQLIEND